MPLSLRTTMENIVDTHRYDAINEACGCQTTVEDRPRVTRAHHAAHVVELIFQCLNGVQLDSVRWNVHQ